MRKFIATLLIALFLIPGTVFAARYEPQKPPPEKRTVKKRDDRSYYKKDYRYKKDFRPHRYDQPQYYKKDWREINKKHHYRMPWDWHSRAIKGRKLIHDRRWHDRFPGLRSYAWNGPGFWYRGMEYRNLVLFYDDDEILVSIGFWRNGRFIMIRDNDRYYWNQERFIIEFEDERFRFRIGW